MRRVLLILGKGLMIGARTAPIVAQLAFPQFAALIEAVSAGILKAEAQFGPGRGLDKKSQVVMALAESARVSLPGIAGQFGRKIDPAELDQAIDGLVEAAVKYYNVVGALPKL